jgi:hypothetical protein
VQRLITAATETHLLSVLDAVLRGQTTRADMPSVLTDGRRIVITVYKLNAYVPVRVDVRIVDMGRE